MSFRLFAIFFVGALIACTDAEEPADDKTWFDPCPTDTPEQRKIDVGEVELNVNCLGEGPTIVFLHGFPEFSLSWLKVMNELSDSYRLIAPDQRGFNLSDKPEAIEDYELPYLTDDIVQLLPLVSAEPVIVVAHDWGGPVGWLVAHTPNAHIRGFISTNGPHPARFVDLIANDPAQQSASAYMEFFRSPQAESFLTPDSLAADFSDFLTEDELKLYMEAWSQPGAITGGLNWYRANPLTVDSVAELMTDLNPTVMVPARVLWGEDDAAVLVSNASELDVYAPDLEVSLFPGVDHWIEHRIPEEIADAVRELDTYTQ